MLTIKIKFLLCLGLIGIISPTQSQSLISPKPKSESTVSLQEIEQRYSSREGYVSFQLVYVDLDVLSDYQDVKANFFDTNVVVTETKEYIRNVHDYSWFGTSRDKKNTILLSVFNEDIQGVITTEKGMFTLETIDNEFVLVKFDQSLFTKGCGTSEGGEESGLLENWSQESKVINSKSVQPFDCKIRVLVLYTQNGASGISSIYNNAQTAIAQMNMTFVNSQISAEVELAHVQLTNYTETASIDNLTRFRDDGDGYMDEVHTLRRQFSADVCVLMCDLPSRYRIYGEAAGIKTCAENSFCIVDVFYATNYYTFSHEIGHLIGCRHDNDQTNSPYTYGHGYQNGSWRTIMGTSYNCSACPRIPYWSNPDVLLSGVPTGTNFINDNARVIDENFLNVMSHRPNNGSLVFNQTIANNAMGGMLYNSNLMSSAGSVVINSPDNLATYAGTQITLSPGFHAVTGSEFVARIVPPCGVPDGMPCNFRLSQNSTTTESIKAFEIEKSNSLSKESKLALEEIDAFPNPTQDGLTVRLNLPESEDKLQIKIMDFNGKVLSTQDFSNVHRGLNSLNISLESLSSGTYFLVVSIDKADVLSHRIVKL